MGKAVVGAVLIVGLWATLSVAPSAVGAARELSGDRAGLGGPNSHSHWMSAKAGGPLGSGILGVPILDDFDRKELPIANGKWAKTGWTEEIGSSWRRKWHGYGATLGNRSGAYWKGAVFSDSNGPVVTVATLGTGPIYERWPNEYLSLWLDMPDPNKVRRAGYEVRFKGARRTDSAYAVELSKWVSGTRTVLAKAEGVSLPVDTKFALSETRGSLAVWVGNSKLTRILSATDSAYRGGYVGIEANRGEGTAYNFRAGNVRAPR